VANRGDKVLHVFLIDAADRSDPEAVGLVQLAGIDDKAARTETMIELFKFEVRIIRITKRGNDVALALCGQVLGETEPAHSRSQCLVISAVAGGASRDATFFTEFFQRSSKGEERVRGRREAELAITFKTFPLREQIETEAARTAFGRFERFASQQHEGEGRLAHRDHAAHRADRPTRPETDANWNDRGRIFKRADPIACPHRTQLCRCTPLRTWSSSGNGAGQVR